MTFMYKDHNFLYRNFLTHGYAIFYSLDPANPASTQLYYKNNLNRKLITEHNKPHIIPNAILHFHVYLIQFLAMLLHKFLIIHPDNTQDSQVLFPGIIPTIGNPVLHFVIVKKVLGWILR